MMKSTIFSISIISPTFKYDCTCSTLLSYKSGKKIMCSHRHERVRNNDFTYECLKSSTFALLFEAECVIVHKGEKKIFCTHRCERVHKNDF